MKRIVLILAIAGMAAAQTTRYPGALDTDSTFYVVSDNVQSVLNLAMAQSDNVAIVKSGTGFAPNMLVTICDTTVAVTSGVSKCSAWEHMLITAANGQSLTVTRGQAGTTPRSHAAGAVISVFIDAAHQKVLKDAVIAVETALGPNLQGSNPGPQPNWASLTTNWADLVRNVGAYPDNALFGSGTTALPEAIRGAINIPASATSGGAHGSGIAGYALSASTVLGAVGSFGSGGVGADGASAWGGNFLVQNCGIPRCNPSQGHTNNVLYGIEIDANIYKLPGGSTPNVVLRGISITGASEVKPLSYAVDVDSLGITQSPRLKWDSAFRTEDGSSTLALDIGTSGTGNDVGSQTISLSSRDGAGVNRTAVIQTGSVGELFVKPGAGASLVLLDGSGNVALTIAPFGSTPWVSIPNQVRAGMLVGPTNVIASETGANNAIAGTFTLAPLSTNAFCVQVNLGHSLQAGANTFNYSGEGALPIKSHFNRTSNIATAYSSGAQIMLCKDAGLLVWLDMAQ